MKLHAACIQTRNAEKLVDFYSRLFGQQPQVDGDVDFRFLDRQLVVFRLTDEDTPATQNATLIYRSGNVDAEYSRLFAAGIRPNATPTDKPWGVRSFLVTDPDGNTISFFTDIP